MYPDTPPAFDGDDHHELRGLQHAARTVTLQQFVLRVTERYKSAWIITGEPLDPVMRSLRESKTFDIRTLTQHHDMLAAYWRRRFGWTEPTLPHLYETPSLVFDWQGWLLREVDDWANVYPHLLRSFCLILVRPNTEAGILDEWSAAGKLADLYPLNRA